MVAIDRRSLIAAGLGGGIAATTAEAGPRANRVQAIGALDPMGLRSESAESQTDRLQALIDAAAQRKAPLTLPPGRFRTGPLTLRPGSRLSGAGAATVLEFTGGRALLAAKDAADVTVETLSLDGAYATLGHPTEGDANLSGLIHAKDCRNLRLDDLILTGSVGHGIRLERCGGRIDRCRITFAVAAGVHSLDAAGLRISGNEIGDCGNNGIQVWRSEAGLDATTVDGNRIERIAALSGGNGQNGNGINIYRAGGVSVGHNRISDCAYSAIRGNAASNLHVVGNTCQRLGEVAIYAEFGFEGALIASNLIDSAATGVSVTNFDVGGRLAVIQGNLIRNLSRREHEPQDKRGEGIAVEADASITGNTIETAATVGIMIGWGRHMRNCVASGNLVRNARIGILISDDPAGGACLVTNNLIAGATAGAIRAMAFGQPHGPDLASRAFANGRITVSANASS